MLIATLAPALAACGPSAPAHDTSQAAKVGSAANQPPNPSPNTTSTAMTEPATSKFVAMDDPRITVKGRTLGGAVRVIGYPGVSVFVSFTGPSLAVKAVSSSGNSRLGVVLDGVFIKNVQLPKGGCDALAAVPLLTDLEPGPHQVEIVHQNETWQGVVAFAGIELGAGGELLAASTAPRKRLLFIGDSVTCGEALLREPGCNKNFEWWDPYNSYGLRLGRLLDVDTNLVCFGGRGLIRDWQGRRDGLNAHELLAMSVPLESPLSTIFPGACGTAVTDLRWDHTRYVPDVIVISLGTNDFNLALGPLPTKQEYVPAYVSLVKELQQLAPNAEIVLTEGSIVSDATDPKRPQKRTLRSYIEATIAELGSARVHFAPATYYPGDSCDAHPTKAQHAHMADDLLPFLQTALGWR
jgi:lysophospholipase L1-like esterase